MTQFVSPYKESPLIAQEVLDWLRNQRGGIINGLEVSAGTTGYKLNINSGRIRMQDGTQIYDDLTKLDVDSVISRGAGDNEHFTIWGSYAYSDTVPPAALTYTSSKTSATPPTLPTGNPAAPVNSIRICDIFIPSAATDILHADIRFVNAPRQPPVGAPGDALLDFISRGAESFAVFSENPITYDDASGDMTFTTDIIIQGLAHSHSQRFNQAPLARVSVDTGQSPLAIPGTPGSRDAIIYAEINRVDPANLASVPTVTLKTVDLTNVTAPGDPNLADFQDVTKVYNLGIVGHVFGDKLFLAVRSGGLPAAGGVIGQALIEAPLGVVEFQSIQDVFLEGGHRVTPWDTGTYADVDAALTGEIPATLRKEGMLVRARETISGLYSERYWDGATWPTYRTANDLGQFGILQGLVPSQPVGTSDIEFTPGRLMTAEGEIFDRLTTEVCAVSVDGTRLVFLDKDFSGPTIVDADYDAAALPGGDMPLAVVERVGGQIVNVRDIRPIFSRATWNRNYLTVGPDTTDGPRPNFTSIRNALLWIGAFDANAQIPREIRIVGNMSFGASANLDGTVDLAGTAVTNASGVTRFLRDFLPDDEIIADGEVRKVVSIADDDNMVVDSAWTGAVGQTYARNLGVGPHSEVIDLTDDLFSGLPAAAMDGITISAEPREGHANGHRVEWGIATTGAQEQGSLFNLGGKSSWSFSDFSIDFDGPATVAGAKVDAHTPFRNLGESCEFNRVEVEAISDLTHIIWQETTALGFGGVDDKPTILRDVVARMNESGGTGLSSYVKCSDDCTGTLKIIDSSFNSQAGTVSRFLELLGTSSAVKVEVSGTKIADVDDLVEGDATVDYKDQPVDFNDCTFSVAVAGNMDVSGTGNDLVAKISRCIIDGNGGGTFDLFGALSAHRCTSVNDAVVELHHTCVADDCDFTTEGTITEYTARVVDGIASSNGFIAGQRGFVPDSICLAPRVNGGNAEALLDRDPVAVTPWLIWPNGRQGRLLSDKTVNIESANDINTAATAVADTVYYFFLVAPAAGLVDAGVMVYSSNPPETDGSLNTSDTPPSLTRRDHLFLGSLVTGSDLAVDANTWKDCRVQYLGGGLRRVTAGTQGFSGTFSDSDAISSAVPASPSGTVELPSLNTTIATAREFEFKQELSITAGNATGTINMDSVIEDQAFLNVANEVDNSGFTVRNTALITVPRMVRAGSDYRADWQASGLASGQPNFVGTVGISVVSYVENINNPIPRVLDNGN